MTIEKKPAGKGTAPAAPRLLTGPASREEARDRGRDGLEVADPARESMLRAQAGDLDAFRGLVEMFQDRVMRVMVAVLKCDRATAEDLCQEVFLNVHKGLPSFDGQVRFQTWMHTIAMNVAISEYRRRNAAKRNRKTVSIDAPVAGSDDLYVVPVGRELDPGERAGQKEFLARVRQCVRELPDEFRAPVVMRDMESLSYEEIGEVLGLPPGTVRSRIHRGRLLLQKKLAEFAP